MGVIVVERLNEIFKVQKTGFLGQKFDFRVRKSILGSKTQFLRSKIPLLGSKMPKTQQFDKKHLPFEVFNPGTCSLLIRTNSGIKSNAGVIRWCVCRRHSSTPLALIKLGEESSDLTWYRIFGVPVYSWYLKNRSMKTTYKCRLFEIYWHSGIRSVVGNRLTVEKDWDYRPSDGILIAKRTWFLGSRSGFFGASVA